MILQAKARPVRIRIKSGGEEHSSFESLMRLFCVKDLLPSAKDGRLSRWLRQQEKDNVAERVEALQESLSLINDPIPEQNYIEFVLAFFDLGDNISTKQELSEKWNVSDCLECQLLKNEIQQELAEQKKKEDINGMKKSYSQALLGYKYDQYLCTQEEWLEIFEEFKTSQAEDADYNWLMFILSRDKSFLDAAAELGHKEALDTINKNNRFGEVVNSGLFKDVFAKISSELNNRKKREEATRMIKNLSAKLSTKEELKILEDILRLLNACDGFICSGEFSILENVQVLKDEALFLQGVFCCGRSNYNRAAEFLLLSKHPLAPLFREFIYDYGKGFIIAKDSLCEIERKEVTADMYRYNSALSYFGMITHFIIVHIFDIISYEKL